MVKCQQKFTEFRKEFVVLKHQRKKLDNLNWKQHIHDIAIKLNRANALLSTGRNYVNKHILRTIYIAIFDSYINYANHIWGQNLNAVSRIVILPKKALRIMSFKSRDSHTQVRYPNPTIFWRQNTWRQNI